MCTCTTVANVQFVRLVVKLVAVCFLSGQNDEHSTLNGHYMFAMRRSLYHHHKDVGASMRVWDTAAQSLLD